MKEHNNPYIKLGKCRERVSQLETVFKINSLLNTELDPNQLLNKIMKTAQKVMKSEIAALALLDKERGDLVFQLVVTDKGSLINALGSMQRLKVGSGINGTVVQTGKALMFKDCRDHPTFNTDYEKRTGIAMGPIMCVPIKAKGEILGSFAVIRKRNVGKPFTSQDLSLFQMFCDSAALALRNAKAYQVLMKNQRLETDITFSRSVQESFLPASFPRHPKYLFAGKMVPSQAVGGDFFDFIPFNKNTLGILLGDVSGKGFAAALHMARLMSDFRYVSQTTQDPAKVLNHINNILCERSRRKSMFATALFILLDMKNHCALAANAGHPPLFLCKRNKKLFEKAKAGGPPLGVIRNSNYEQTKISMNSGDLIFLFSDGLLEARNDKKKFFGIKRLREFLKTQDKNPRTMVNQLHKQLRAFAKGNKPHDDISMVAFKLR